MDKHDILMITYNRPEYTRMALAQLLESCDEAMRVWVWHNGEDQETLQAVRDLSGHPCFHHLEISRENKRLREPTNWFWRNTDGAYLTKVDDDCLLPPGWGKTLRDAHTANPGLGIIGCWRFYEEDFNEKQARKKIIRLGGGFELMKNPWVQGSSYVMKRACQAQQGDLQERESFYTYCLRAALAGWQNGWLFPFIHEEHMDDPRSPYCLIRTDEEFMAQQPLSAKNDNVTTVKEWASRVRYMAHQVQVASPNPRAHTGWRRSLTSLKNRVKRLAGIREPWRLK